MRVIHRRDTCVTHQTARGVLILTTAVLIKIHLTS